MIRRKKISKCIIDINTQEDLFLARSSYCVRDHSRVLSHIRRIMAWARVNNCLVVSICRVFPYDNFSYTACRKISYTIFNNRFVFPVTSSTDVPVNIWYPYQQIVFYSRSNDSFDEPLIERLLSESSVREFILVGAVAENSVYSVVLGLLQRGKNVSFISDAVGYHDYRARNLLLRKIKEKGVKIIETKELAGVSHLRQIGACNCSSCRSREKAFIY